MKFELMKPNIWFMEKEGARYQPLEEQLERRKEVVTLHKKGIKEGRILDNLRVHHSKLVKARVVQHEDKIELFYLPTYSPEERFNADLKQEMSKRLPSRTKYKLLEAANEHMTMLGDSPVRVMAYFQNRRVRNARLKLYKA